MKFHLMCVHITFSSVLVAEWPPFGKTLLTWVTIYSLCILTICNNSYFSFWFWGVDLGLIALVPDLCIILNLTWFNKNVC